MRTRSYDRLPEWAKREMERLESNARDAQRRLEDTIRGRSASAFVERWEPLDGAEKRIPLVDGRVVFVLGDGTEISAKVSDQGLELNASSHPYRLAVLPGCANVVVLRNVELRS